MASPKKCLFSQFLRKRKHNFLRKLFFGEKKKRHKNEFLWSSPPFRSMIESGRMRLPSLGVFNTPIWVLIFKTVGVYHSIALVKGVLRLCFPLTMSLYKRHHADGRLYGDLTVSPFFGPFFIYIYIFFSCSRAASLH